MHVSSAGLYSQPNFSNLILVLLRFDRPCSPNNRSDLRDTGYWNGPSPRRNLCVTRRLFIVESAMCSYTVCLCDHSEPDWALLVASHTHNGFPRCRELDPP